MKKILIINILSIIGIICLIEILAFLIIFFSISKDFFTKKSYRDFHNWFSIRNMRLAEDFAEFRPISKVQNPSKKPIVILGCSYAYGTTLNNDETISAYLSKYTNRDVYNLGLQSMGTVSALYLLEKQDIKNKIPDTDLFIYLFIYDHIRRNYLSMPNIVYNYFSADLKIDRKGNLYFSNKNKTQMFIESFYTNRLIQNFYANNKTKSGDLSLLKAILIQMKSIIKKKYPNSNFVMIVYEDEPEFHEDGSLNLDDDPNLTKMCNEIGIKIIYTKQLSSGRDIFQRKHIAFDGYHPTKEAWKKLVPELSKILNL